MSSEAETHRPRAVTVIGWICLVLAGLFLLRSLLDLVVWKMLQPAAPSLFAAAEDQSPRLAFLRPLFAHLTAIKVAEAIVSLAVGVFAYAFLRLRPWAYVAVQAVCWLALAYIVSFGVLWVGIWTHMPVGNTGGPLPSSYSHRAIGLIGGLTVLLLFALGLAMMIAVLRSSRVRAAFRRPGASRGRPANSAS